MTSHTGNLAKVFLISKVMLAPLGLWHADDAFIRRDRKFGAFFAKIPAASIILVLAAAVFALTLTNLVVVKHPLPRFIFILCVLMRLLSVMQKILALKRSKMEMREMFEECFDFGTVPQEIKGEYDRYLNSCNKLPMTLIIHFSSIVIIFLPFWIFASEERSNPIPVWLPENFDLNHPYLSKIAFIFLAMSLMLVTVVFIGFNSYQILLSTVCSLMLQHLVEVLGALSTPERFMAAVVENDVDEESYHKKIEETLKYMHNLHLKIIRITECVNKRFSNVILLEVWSILLAQCACALLIAGDIMQLKRVIALLQNIMFLTIQFGIMCYESNKIVTLNERVHSSCLDTAWWSWSKDNILFVKMMSIRTSEPLFFRVGSFKPLSLGTFLVMLQFSFSYFMFLHQFKQVKNI